MAFENQIRIVSVVKICLIEQVLVFKRMPYERQLKERQVYKTLSICVELIKSDANLKFRLKISFNVIHRIRFQGIEYQKCSMCLWHSNIQRITSKLDSIHHKDNKRKRVILTSYWRAKIRYKRLCFLIFLTFSVIANLLAYVRVKISS